MENKFNKEEYLKQYRAGIKRCVSGDEKGTDIGHFFFAHCSECPTGEWPHEKWVSKLLGILIEEVIADHYVSALTIDLNAVKKFMKDTGYQYRRKDKKVYFGDKFVEAIDKLYGLESQLINLFEEEIEKEAGIINPDKEIEKYGLWEEHPDHIRDNWRADVSNGDTQRGYWDWVKAEIEQRNDREAKLKAIDEITKTEEGS